MNSSVESLTIFNGELIGGGFEIGALSAVLSLTNYNGELIAGGLFSTMSEEEINNIARWNETQWLSIGSEMNGRVLALTVYNGDLIAGGSFITVDEKTVNQIARWGLPE